MELHLFNHGLFGLHSGSKTSFLIDCRALTEEDWLALAELAARSLPAFSAVEGVPTGGIAFAEALEAHIQPVGRLLIVDDVYTTGRSMEEHRRGRDALGCVLFARAPTPLWVWAMFPVPCWLRTNM